MGAKDFRVWILGGKWSICKYTCNSYSFKGRWQEYGLIHYLNFNIYFAHRQSDVIQIFLSFFEFHETDFLAPKMFFNLLLRALRKFTLAKIRALPDTECVLFHWVFIVQL